MTVAIHCAIAAPFASARGNLHSKILCLLGSYAYRSDESRPKNASYFFDAFKNIPGFREWFQRMSGRSALRSVDINDPNAFYSLLAQFKRAEPPHAKSRTLDLTQNNQALSKPARAHANPQLQRVRDPRSSTSSIQADYKKSPMLQYEAEVLSLARGDAVKVNGQREGGKSITLGPFLGAGNSNHVWRQASNPERVLRIPFIPGFRLFQREAGARSVNYQPPIDYARDHIQSDMAFEGKVRAAVEQSANQCAQENAKMPRPRMVKVYDYGKNWEFAEMEYVRKQYDAVQWVNRIESAHHSDLMEFFEHSDLKTGAWKKLASADALKMRSLFLLTEAILKQNRWTSESLKKLSKNSKENKRRLYLAVLRNAVWDGKTWVVNDWEVLPSSEDDM